MQHDEPFKYINKIPECGRKGSGDKERLIFVDFVKVTAANYANV